jgi:LysM repeat protein
MRIFLFTIVGLFFFRAAEASIIEADSIGIEKIAGKIYVLHEVEEKETLYSISKRYKVSIDDIVGANPAAEFGLDIGVILKVPVTSGLTDDKGRITHEVLPGQTLYSISRQYNVAPEDIKKWNRISTNLLDIGQKLVIVPPEKPMEEDTSENVSGEGYVYHQVAEGETLYSLARQYDVPLETLREWNDLNVNDIAIGDSLIVEKAITKDGSSNKDPDETAASGVIYAESGLPMARENINFDEVVERGLAEVIEGSSSNSKYLALHRTAETGTIMRVRNEMNGQEVFVRIIGKLPDTGANRNILLKISRAAYEQLGAIDARFRVTISFIP